MSNWFRRMVPLAGFVLLGSCTEMSPIAPEEIGAFCAAAGASVAGVADAQELDPLFAAAAAEFDVPAELLKAIGWVETRWQMVEGHPEFPGQPAAFGIMALRDGARAEAARLAGVTDEMARTDAGANIRAAAALLRQFADQEALATTDLGAWAPAVARYSGIAHAEGRAAYVHEDVYGVLRSGVQRIDVQGPAPATLAPLDVWPSYAATPQPAAVGASTDFAGAVWRASPNFNARPAGAIGAVAVVVIHTCEGSYTGCWSWLVNPDSRVSAHYVVSEDGSQITQLVRDTDRGWHIGSSYDCGLNQQWECWRNGQSNNHFTIGVEHAGYASQRFWPSGQLDASARLVCDVTRRHGIARDNIRIVGHAQLQPHNRTDPGANWPWAEFRARIDAHCGAPAPAELIVDSSDGNNDPARARMELSSAWTATSATPGFFGTGYHFASTGPDADPATFHFFLPEPGTRTVDAWWTAGTNRSSRAAFRALDAAGAVVGAATTNQQTDGSRWVTLGSWAFPAGWNRVQLSREGARGCVVIADAIRVR